MPTDIRPLAPLVHSATLTQYNEFGQRVDRLHTSEGWRQLERFAILAAEVFEENIFKDNWVFWSTFTGIDKNERWPGPNQVCIGPL